ncbi:efflux RND transporter periplasmic adaptor subunit [Treponema parvum]|uniref:efflux RND transporter periplasmic adaptor subunit n=1 Tax=Treponema parvum TaxID=138851 RepID=UPI001AEC3E79|nr:efflux RND transporter periplasmic adaptor subunit [Treponema parvum]QTQ17204.1 efflux RND transporter periplasmic adaptor subunit [Treponema parvum]
MRAGKFLFVVPPIFFIFTSCFSKKNDSAQTFRAASVNTVIAKEEAKDTKISTFGTVSYKTKHDVSSLVEGSVQNLFAKEGDFVRKGQKLAVLRNVQMENQKEQYENALCSAEASLSVALSQLREEELSVQSRLLSLEKQELSIRQKEIEYENACQIHWNNEELHKLGGITDVSFKSEELSLQSQKTSIDIAKKEMQISSLGLTDSDIVSMGYAIPDSSEEKNKLLIKLNTQSVQAQIQSAKASVSNAEKNLQSINRLIEELTVKAGVEGIIGARNFEEGEYVAANAAVFTILNTSSVYAVFSIQEKDILKYHEGTPVNIELPSINKSLLSVISEISPFADPQSGNFTVKALLENPGRSIKPGIFVKSTILQTDNPVFVVLPETAVIQSNQSKSRNIVYTVKNGCVVLQNVEIDSIENGKAWIKSGIKEGTVVIDKPSPFLKEGENVVTN